MSDETLLSELCSICHQEKPKYRCPRCKTQTCSLPCYKKHQRRASCNGQRDPSTYLKKSQLATPAGLDQDFNYLHNIEESITAANRHVLPDRRAQSGHTAYQNIATGRREDSRFQQYLARHAITVQRAPKGMTRERSNASRATKSHDALWTIEWILESGEVKLQHDCPESDSLRHLWELSRPKDQAVLSQRQGKKRKRVVLEGEQRVAEEGGTPLDEQEASGSSVDRAILPSHQSGPQEADSRGDTTSQALQGQTASEKISPPKVSRRPPTPTNGHTATPTTSPHPSQPPPTTTHSSKQVYFYLHKPLLPTNRKVLIPLDAAATLTQALANQTILEYPSIYVLPLPPEELSEPEAGGAGGKGWMLEKDYRATAEGEREEGDVRRGEEIGSSRNVEEGERGRVDSGKILEMLRRDISRV